MKTKPSNRMVPWLAAATVMLSLGLTNANAGPTEDFTQGAKAYANGDLIAALPLLRRAADAGHAQAQADLADILVQTDAGEEAVPYYRKSAEQGNASGQYGYGVMLSAGEGIAKNPAEAKKWITLAAKQGHKLAIAELATAYLNGYLGIPEEARTGAEALHWIQIAAEQGLVPAMDALSAAYKTGAYGLTADAKLSEQWAEKSRKASGLKKGRKGRKASE